jgi:poly(3-hydroxybutyrate) depolymerase
LAARCEAIGAWIDRGVVNTKAPHISPRGLRRLVFLIISAALIAAAGTTAQTGSARTTTPAAPLVYTITYLAHTGDRREATVLLPAGYSPDANPAIPLVISPHGRGATGQSNATFWGSLPTVGHFAVVNPDGMGRRLKAFSYGAPGHIDDLARMPEIVTEALPWVRIDRSRIYALGSSMGGQETLLLVARHPHLLAGAAAMDSVTDLALRYEQARELPTSPAFVKRWGAPNSVALQGAMRREVGGTPEAKPKAYAARSPLSQAAAIARSGVPLQIWWSRKDRIVVHQNTQSGALYRELRRIGTRASLEAYVGTWKHSTEMRAGALLPLALRGFGLLPRDCAPCPAGVQHLV